MVATPLTTAKQDAARYEELVRRGLSLVHAIVAEVAGRVPRFVGRDELVSAGMLGLTQAAQAWDAERGVPFERFARIRIRGAIVDELRGRDWASRSVRTSGRVLQSAGDALAATLGRAPTNDEIAQRIGRDANDVAQLQHDLSRAMVLRYDAMLDDPEGGAVFADPTDGPEAKLLDAELTDCLHDALCALPERLRDVVVGYFYDGREMQEIAEELGVTPSRVSQLCSEALALLKDGINSQLEPEAVGDLHVTKGRVARRKAAYYGAVAEAAAARTRRDVDRARPLPRAVGSDYWG